VEAAKRSWAERVSDLVTRFGGSMTFLYLHLGWLLWNLAARRNHLDLQINLLSEQENSKMLAMLAALMRQQGLALDDPEVVALQEATQPEVLLQQLEQALEPPTQEESGAPPPPPQTP
jgi:uncharacterized membrane protein